MLVGPACFLLERCVLPWAEPSRGLAPPSAAQPSALLLGAPNPDEDPPADLQAPPAPLENSGGSSSSSGGSVGSGGRGVCTVTSIVECPDVVGRCSEEWRSGISQLAVSSSRGDVILIKV